MLPQKTESCRRGILGSNQPGRTGPGEGNSKVPIFQCHSGKCGYVEQRIQFYHGIARRALNLARYLRQPTGKITLRPPQNDPKRSRAVTASFMPGNHVILDDFEYSIDSNRSGITAYLDVEEPRRLSWELCVQALPNPAFDEDDDAPLEPPNAEVLFTVPGLRDWRGLENREITVSFREEDYQRILPGKLANLYIGFHLFPKEHRITFGARTGTRIEIHWTCSARPYPEDTPIEFLADGVLTFHGVSVTFEELSRRATEELHGETDFEAVAERLRQGLKKLEPDTDEAMRALRSCFDPADFAAAEIRGWTVFFPSV